MLIVLAIWYQYRNKQVPFGVGWDETEVVMADIA